MTRFGFVQFSCGHIRSDDNPNYSMMCGCSNPGHVILLDHPGR